MTRRQLLGLGGVAGAGMVAASAAGAHALLPSLTSYTADFSGPAGSPWPSGWTPWLGSSADRDGGISTYGFGTDVAYVDGAGHGVIRAYRDGSGWHSAFLYGPDFTWGTLTGTVKLPTGQGIFPAFWIVCSDCDTGGWPNHGEIDLIETVNDGSTRYTTLNFPELLDPASNLALQTQGAFDPSVWHTFSCGWHPGSVTVTMDGATVGSWRPLDVLGAGGRWCYGEGHSMKPVLNICVGAEWPGPPDATTPDAVELLVSSLTIAP